MEKVIKKHKTMAALMEKTIKKHKARAALVDSMTAARDARDEGLPVQVALDSVEMVYTALDMQTDVPIATSMLGIALLHAGLLGEHRARYETGIKRALEILSA